MNPKNAWQCIIILIDGFKNHNSKDVFKIRDENGLAAISDAENIQLVASRFQKLFGRDTEVDFEDTSRTKQKVLINELGEMISFDQFSHTSDELELDKVPGTNSMSHSALKVLDVEIRAILLGYIKHWM